MTDSTLIVHRDRRITFTGYSGWEDIIWRLSANRMLTPDNAVSSVLEPSIGLLFQIERALHSNALPVDIALETGDITAITPERVQEITVEMTTINSGHKRDPVPSPLEWALSYVVSDPDDRGPSVFKAAERIVLVAVATLIERAAKAGAPVSEVPLYQLRKALTGMRDYEIPDAIEELVDRDLLVQVRTGAWNLPADAYGIEEEGS